MNNNERIRLKEIEKLSASYKENATRLIELEKEADLERERIKKMTPEEKVIPSNFSKILKLNSSIRSIRKYVGSTLENKRNNNSSSIIPFHKKRQLWEESLEIVRREKATPTKSDYSKVVNPITGRRYSTSTYKSSTPAKQEETNSKTSKTSNSSESPVQSVLNTDYSKVVTDNSVSPEKKASNSFNKPTTSNNKQTTTKQTADKQTPTKQGTDNYNETTADLYKRLTGKSWKNIKNDSRFNKEYDGTAKNNLSIRQKLQELLNKERQEENAVRNETSNLSDKEKNMVVSDLYKNLTNNNWRDIANDKTYGKNYDKSREGNLALRRQLLRDLNNKKNKK